MIGFAQQAQNADDPSWLAALLVAGLVSLVMVGTAWLVRSLAEKGADGRLKRNDLAGVRTRATMASDEAWLAAHQAALPDSLTAATMGAMSGVLSFGAAGLLGALGAVGATGFLIAWTAVLLTLVTLMVAFLVRGTIKGNRAARATGGS